MPLKDRDGLERSPVVANSAMNRLRVLAGPNGYAADLGFDVAAWLAKRLAAQPRATWVDLCCGAARALDEAATRFDGDPATRGRLTIVGVDLAAAHDRRSAAPGVAVVAANVERWSPDGPVDLVTCVHGLHYVGDKLGLVTRALGWLAPGGRFAANLDPANVKVDQRPGSRVVLAALRAAGVTWDGRRRALRADGPRQLDFDLTYRGADDGPAPTPPGSRRSTATTRGQPPPRAGSALHAPPSLVGRGDGPLRAASVAMDERWLERADAVGLWVLGGCLAAVVDVALVSAFRVSPVLGNPLRDVHAGALDVIGWLILGAPLWATLVLARTSRSLQDLPGWALQLASPIAGLAMTWGWTREWRHAWLAPLSLLAALVLPALECRRSGAGWRSAWVMSMSLIVLFLSQDPGHGIARSAFPRAVVWWIGVAACGAGMAAPLWRSGLRLSAMATTCFWSCAFWSLLANSREVSKFSVGLLGVVWRSSGWHRYLGAQHAPTTVMDFVWPSVPMLALLLVVLHFGPRAITWLGLRARGRVRTAWAWLRQRRRSSEVLAP